MNNIFRLDAFLKEGWKLLESPFPPCVNISPSRAYTERLAHSCSWLKGDRKVNWDVKVERMKQRVKSELPLGSEWLTYLLQNHESIPQSLIGRSITFDGQIFRDIYEEDYVLCMMWQGTVPVWGCYSLIHSFDSQYASLVLMT